MEGRGACVCVCVATKTSGRISLRLVIFFEYFFSGLRIKLPYPPDDFISSGSGGFLAEDPGATRLHWSSLFLFQVHTKKYDEIAWIFHLFYLEV